MRELLRTANGPRDGALTRELGWVAIGSGAAVALTALSTKLFTNWLSQDEYGKLALGLTLAAFVGQGLFGWLTSAVVRYLPIYRDRRATLALTQTIGAIVVRLAGLSIVGATALGVLTAWFDPSWGLLLASCLVFGTAQGLMTLLAYVSTARRDRLGAAIRQALLPTCKVIFGGGAIWFIAPKSWVATVGLALGTSLVLAVLTRGLRSHAAISVAERARVSLELWRYGRYFLIWAVAYGIQFSSDLWALKIFTDDATVGIYAVALLFASVMTMVQAVLMQFLFPLVFDLVGEATSRSRLRQAAALARLGTVAMICVGVACSLATIWLGNAAVEAVSTPAFLAAAPLIPFVVLGAALLQAGEIMTLVALALVRLREATVLKVAVAVLVVASNVLAARNWGAGGVAASLLFGGAAYLVLSTILAERILRSAADSAISELGP